MTTQFEAIIRGLAKSDVQFILIGGLAARAHGSAYITDDIDICYQRTPENIAKLVKFLKSVHAKLRVARNTDELPFILDEKTLKMGMNFTFHTDLGNLDILGEFSGVGDYLQAEALSESLEIFGCDVLVLSVDGLIRAKRAASRPKDLLLLKELEALREVIKK